MMARVKMESMGSTAQKSIEGFVSDKRASMGRTSERRKRAGFPKRLRERCKDEAMCRVRENNWEGAKASHFVALHQVLYEECYGVPLDLGSREFKMAAMAAGQLLKNEFGGSPIDLLSFMRWVWKREMGREKWRRENNHNGGTLEWAHVFRGGKALRDYKIASNRRRYGA